MRNIAAIMLMCASAWAHSETYITCDPYPASANQPTRFMMQIDGGAFLDSAILRCDAAGASANPKLCTAANNNVVLKHAISTLPWGPHTAKAKACDLSSCSAESAALNFDIGVAVPQVLKILVQ